MQTLEFMAKRQTADFFIILSPEHDAQAPRSGEERSNNDTLSVTGVVIYLIGQIAKFGKAFLFVNLLPEEEAAAGVRTANTAL